MTSVYSSYPLITSGGYLYSSNPTPVTATNPSESEVFTISFSWPYRTGYITASFPPITVYRDLHWATQEASICETGSTAAVSLIQYYANLPPWCICTTGSFGDSCQYSVTISNTHFNDITPHPITFTEPPNLLDVTYYIKYSDSSTYPLTPFSSPLRVAINLMESIPPDTTQSLTAILYTEYRLTTTGTEVIYQVNGPSITIDLTSYCFAQTNCDIYDTAQCDLDQFLRGASRTSTSCVCKEGFYGELCNHTISIPTVSAPYTSQYQLHSETLQYDPRPFVATDSIPLTLKFVCIGGACGSSQITLTTVDSKLSYSGGITSGTYELHYTYTSWGVTTTNKIPQTITSYTFYDWSRSHSSPPVCGSYTQGANSGNYYTNDGAYCICHPGAYGNKCRSQLEIDRLSISALVTIYFYDPNTDLQSTINDKSPEFRFYQGDPITGTYYPLTYSPTAKTLHINTAIPDGTYNFQMRYDVEYTGGTTRLIINGYQTITVSFNSQPCLTVVGCSVIGSTGCSLANRLAPPGPGVGVACTCKTGYYGELCAETFSLSLPPGIGPQTLATTPLTYTTSFSTPIDSVSFVLEDDSSYPFIINTSSKELTYTSRIDPGTYSIEFTWTYKGNEVIGTASQSLTIITDLEWAINNGMCSADHTVDANVSMYPNSQYCFCAPGYIQPCSTNDLFSVTVQSYGGQITSLYTPIVLHGDYLSTLAMMEPIFSLVTSTVYDRYSPRISLTFDDIDTLTMSLQQFPPPNTNYYILVEYKVPESFYIFITDDSTAPINIDITLPFNDCITIVGCVEDNTLACNVSNNALDIPNGPACTCKPGFIGDLCDTTVTLYHPLFDTTNEYFPMNQYTFKSNPPSYASEGITLTNFRLTSTTLGSINLTSGFDEITSIDTISSTNPLGDEYELQFTYVYNGVDVTGRFQYPIKIYPDAIWVYLPLVNMCTEANTESFDIENYYNGSELYCTCRLATFGLGCEYEYTVAATTMNSFERIDVTFVGPQPDLFSYDGYSYRLKSSTNNYYELNAIIAEAEQQLTTIELVRSLYPPDGIYTLELTYRIYISEIETVIAFPYSTPITVSLTSNCNTLALCTPENTESCNISNYAEELDWVCTCKPGSFGSSCQYTMTFEPQLAGHPSIINRHAFMRGITFTSDSTDFTGIRLHYYENDYPTATFYEVTKAGTTLTTSGTISDAGDHRLSYTYTIGQTGVIGTSPPFMVQDDTYWLINTVHACSAYPNTLYGDLFPYYSKNMKHCICGDGYYDVDCSKSFTLDSSQFINADDVIQIVGMTAADFSNIIPDSQKFYLEKIGSSPIEDHEILFDSTTMTLALDQDNLPPNSRQYRLRFDYDMYNEDNDPKTKSSYYGNNFTPITVAILDPVCVSNMGCNAANTIFCDADQAVAEPPTGPVCACKDNYYGPACEHILTFPNLNRLELGQGISFEPPQDIYSIRLSPSINSQIVYDLTYNALNNILRTTTPNTEIPPGTYILQYQYNYRGVMTDVIHSPFIITEDDTWLFANDYCTEAGTESTSLQQLYSQESQYCICTEYAFGKKCTPLVLSSTEFTDLTSIAFTDPDQFDYNHIQDISTHLLILDGSSNTIGTHPLQFSIQNPGVGINTASIPPNGNTNRVQMTYSIIFDNGQLLGPYIITSTQPITVNLDCIQLAGCDAAHTTSCHLDQFYAQQPTTAACVCSSPFIGDTCSTPFFFSDYEDALTLTFASEHFTSSVLEHAPSITLSHIQLIATDYTQYQLRQADSSYIILSDNVIPIGVYTLNLEYRFKITGVATISIPDLTIISGDDWLISNNHCNSANTINGNILGLLRGDEQYCFCRNGYYGMNCASQFELSTTLIETISAIGLEFNPTSIDQVFQNVQFSLVPNGATTTTVQYMLDYNRNDAQVTIREANLPPDGTNYRLHMNAKHSSTIDVNYYGSQSITVSLSSSLCPNTSCVAENTLSCSPYDESASSPNGPACLCKPGFIGNTCADTIELTISSIFNQYQLTTIPTPFETTSTLTISNIQLRSTNPSASPQTYELTIPNPHENEFIGTQGIPAGTYYIEFTYPYKSISVHGSFATTLTLMENDDFMFSEGLCNPDYTDAVQMGSYYDDLSDYCICAPTYYDQDCSKQFILLSTTISPQSPIRIGASDFSTITDYRFEILHREDRNWVATPLVYDSSLKTLSLSETEELPPEGSDLTIVMIYKQIGDTTSERSVSIEDITVQHITHPIRITTSTFDQATRKVELKWTLSQRDSIDFPSTIYHSFYLFETGTIINTPTLSTISLAKAILHGSTSSTTFSSTTTIYNNLIHIPETILQITLSIPNLPTLSNGFEILMVPRNLPSGISLDDEMLLIPITSTQVNNICVTNNIQCQNNGQCNVYTGQCQCPQGFFGPTCNLTTKPIETTCTLKCPPLMTPTSNCKQCICTTDRCRTYTRATMLYLKPSSTTTSSLLSTTYSTSLIQSILPRHIQHQLNLNQLPLLPTVYSTPSFILGSSTTKAIGIETITLLPIVKDSTDVNAIALFITIQPFVTTPTVEQINNRFATILQRLSTLVTTSTLTTFQFSPLSYMSTLLTTNFGSTSRQFATTWKQFDIGTPTTTNVLLTVCQNPTTLLWSQCSTLPTSLQWSTCPNPITTISSRELTVGCLDYNNYIWTTSFDNISWCNNNNYALYPSTTTLPNSCIPPNTPPDQLPPPPPPTSLKLPIITPQAVAPAGSLITVNWTYIGNPAYTVSIFLTGVTMLEQNYNSPIDSFIQFDTMSLRPTNDTSISTDEFSTLQTTSSRYLLGTFPATINTANVLIPILTEPTYNADFLIMVTQNSTTRVLASSNMQYYYSISEPQLCENVTCQDQSAQCDNYTGECKCDAGYQMPLDSIDSTTSMCELTCTDMCQNGGTCGFDSTSKSSKCTCPTGFTGDFCETKTGCQQQFCNQHGYIITTPNTFDCTEQCRCEGNWFTETSNTDNAKQCLSCQLRNVCDETGTDFTLTETTCTTCMCKNGYAGDHCQLRSMVGTLNFEKTETITIGQYNILQDDDDIEDDSDIMPSYSTRSLFGIQQLPPPTTVVTPITLPLSQIRQLTQDMALSLNLDQSNVNVARSTSTVTTTPISTTQATQSTVTGVTFQITSQQTSSGSGGSGTTMNDLYSSWNNLKENFATSPIANSDLSKSFGAPQPVQGAFDPNCIPSDTVECPDGEDPFAQPPPKPIVPIDGGDDVNDGPSSRRKSNTTTIIIAVVVVVVILALVALLAILIKYSYSKKIWCFAEPEGKKRGHTSGVELSQATHGTHLTENDPNNNNNEMTQNANESISTPTHGSISSPSSPSARTSISDANQAYTRQSLRTTYDFGGSQQAPQLARQRSTSQSSNNRSSSATVDLIPVEDEESASLPSGWSKWKHRETGDVFYTNDAEMKSQRHAPGKESTAKGRWF